jgi:hypothetical protein
VRSRNADVDNADNVRKETTLPWMSFASDEAAPSPEGIFLESYAHPRACGNFARLPAKYVRADKAVTLQDAIHRLTALPAANLSLKDRGGRRDLRERGRALRYPRQPEIQVVDISISLRDFSICGQTIKFARLRVHTSKMALDLH